MLRDLAIILLALAGVAFVAAMLVMPVLDLLGVI